MINEKNARRGTFAAKRILISSCEVILLGRKRFRIPVVFVAFYEHTVDDHFRWDLRFAHIHDQGASTRKFAAFTKVFIMLQLGKCYRIRPALFRICLRNRVT